MNKSLTEKIKSASLATAKSQKTGSEYTTMKIEFINGYVFQTFLNSEQLFILNKFVNDFDSNLDSTNSKNGSFLDE